MKQFESQLDSDVEALLLPGTLVTLLVTLSSLSSGIVWVVPDSVSTAMESNQYKILHAVASLA